MFFFDLAKAFFTSEGRADRRLFWWTVVWLVLSVLVVLVVAVLFAEGGLYEDDIPQAWRMTIFGVSVVPLVIFAGRFRGICVRRSRDARSPKHLETLKYIPYLRLIRILALGFLPSRTDPMEEAVAVFGDAPEPAPARVPQSERREPTFS